jgi:hypothetical protein
MFLQQGVDRRNDAFFCAEPQHAATQAPPNPLVKYINLQKQKC